MKNNTYYLILKTNINSNCEKCKDFKCFKCENADFKLLDENLKVLVDYKNNLSYLHQKIEHYLITTPLLLNKNNINNFLSKSSNKKYITKLNRSNLRNKFLSYNTKAYQIIKNEFPSKLKVKDENYTIYKDYDYYIIYSINYNINNNLKDIKYIFKKYLELEYGENLANYLTSHKDINFTLKDDKIFIKDFNPLSIWLLKTKKIIIEKTLNFVITINEKIKTLTYKKR